MKPVRQTDRAFGLMFAVALTVITGVVWLIAGQVVETLLYIAGGFLVFALVAPAVLFPLNRLWGWFAHKLGTVNNHLLLGLVYGLAIIPAGLIMKLFRRDPMHRRLGAEAGSYFVPVGRHTNAETLRDLF